MAEKFRVLTWFVSVIPSATNFISIEPSVIASDQNFLVHSLENLELAYFSKGHVIACAGR